MRCYYHPEREAVSSCSCGKFLCKECTDRYSPIQCEDCHNASLVEDSVQSVLQSRMVHKELRRDVFHFFLMMLIGVVLAVFYYSIAMYVSISKWGFAVWLFIPYAFHSVRNYYPGGGCLVLLLKFFVAWTFGFVFYAVQLFKMCRRIRKAQENVLVGILLEVMFLATNGVLLYELVNFLFRAYVKPS